MDKNCAAAANREHSSTKIIKRENIHHSKVDIKEIRKKFERLSNASESSAYQTEPSFTPKAPARKNKVKGENLNGKKESTLGIANTVDSNKYVPIVNKSDCIVRKSNSSNLSSVKERTKLFETCDSTEKLLREPSAQFTVSNLQTVNTTNEKTMARNVSGKQFDTPVNTSAPPTKPPRSFTYMDKEKEFANDICNANNKVLKKNISSENFHSKFNESNANSKPRNASLSFSNETESINRDSSVNPKSRSVSASYSFETETSKKSTPKSPRLLSAPEILSTPKVPQSTPKTHFSNKTQGIFNYFKNLSNTANNMYEKVKQKQSNVFVDLTPTTVSPPKHYDTLKRSHSEENIYAELIPVNKTHSSTVPENSNDTPKSLHYMCTPLIQPRASQMVKDNDGHKLSSQSVRNVIYSSFAVLRALPKDNLDSSTDTPAADGAEADLKAIQDRIIYVKSVKKQISSSSLCLSPKLYELLLIVNVSENQPEVSYTFPSKIPDVYNYPLLPHICFPDASLYKTVAVYQSDTFQFSLLDKEEKVYGYCLRILGWPDNGFNKTPLCVKLPVAICILSNFSAPVFYKKLLTEIEKHLTLPREKFFKYLLSLRKLGVPNAGASLSIPDFTEGEEPDRVVISRPLDSHIVGFEMTRTLQLLDIDIFVKSVASLLLERRVLLFSASTSNLYQCCKAISSVLYPFEWPHLIVPVLPTCLILHCCSELPYILGILGSNINTVLELLSEHQLLIIDVDKGTVVKSCNDEDTILPRKVQKAVITALNLAKNMTDPTEMLRDIMISEAFVHMFVEMIGHYENHFIEQNGNLILHKEGLLKNAFSHSIRSFLQWFSETQMFDAFIEESLWRIKYRNICQTNLRTFFEKRIDEYKWELSHDGEKLSRMIGKTVRNFGEKLRGLKKI